MPPVMRGEGQDRRKTPASCSDTSPGDRITIALELGRRALEIYLAAHPDATLGDARDLMMKRNRFSRRPSLVAEGRRG